MSKKRLIKILIAGFHATFMVFFTLLLLYLDIPYDDRSLIVKISGITKKLIFSLDEKPDRKEFLFINTSYANELIPRFDAAGFQIGDECITNRAALAELFARINKSPPNYKFILCDIFFKNRSPNDSLLRKEITGLYNIIIPYHISKGNQVERPVFEVLAGYADYPKLESDFMKFKLMLNDTVKSIPLLLHEKINNLNTTKHFLVNHTGDGFSLNTVLIDFSIRNFDINNELGNNSFPVIEINDLLEIEIDSVFNEYLAGRYIVIGDFREKDFHSTPFGEMSGALILTNTFLTIKNGQDKLSFLFIVYLFIVFIILSLYVFSIRTRDKMKSKFTRIRRVNLPRKFLIYLAIFVTISIFSYSLFNIHLNIIVLSFYFNVIDILVSARQKKKPNEEQSQ